MVHIPHKCYHQCTYICVMVVSFIMYSVYGSESDHTERMKTMNETNTMNNENTQSSDWIEYVNQVTIAHRGTFMAKDGFDAPLILEWEKVDAVAPRLSAFIKEVSEILVLTYSSMELEFAKKHPEAISSDLFLKPLKPMVTEGIAAIDWKIAENALQSHLAQFFSATDFAQYAKPGEVHLFVTAKDAQTNEPLGVINFIVTPGFEYGTVKVAFYGTLPTAVSREIEKILMSSIFTLLPATTRIFLHTRITNESLLRPLRIWGFTQFSGPLPYWADMEYVAKSSDGLQKAADVIRS